jgi:hypothetical protein
VITVLLPDFFSEATSDEELWLLVAQPVTEVAIAAANPNVTILFNTLFKMFSSLFFAYPNLLAIVCGTGSTYDYNRTRFKSQRLLLYS